VVLGWLVCGGGVGGGWGVGGGVGGGVWWVVGGGVGGGEALNPRFEILN